MSHRVSANKYRLLLVIILSMMHPKISQNVGDEGILTQGIDQQESARSEGVGIKETRQQAQGSSPDRRPQDPIRDTKDLTPKTQLLHDYEHGVDDGLENYTQVSNEELAKDPQSVKMDQTQQIIKQKIGTEQKRAQEKSAKSNQTVIDRSEIGSTATEANSNVTPSEEIVESKGEKNQGKSIPKLELIQLLQKQIGNAIKYLQKITVQNVPVDVSVFMQRIVIGIVNCFSRKLLPFIRPYYQLYRIMTNENRPRPKKVYYENNYANLYGGAKIIMKSSPKIKSINSILEDGTDKYMYTDEQLPIKVIIGLNEEIAIDSIIIQSYEMYSCITKDFMVEGKFTMEDKKWVYLGMFKAENTFGDQQFYTDRKIVRYIKITFLSAYGKWSYFTLTQIKIRGKGLFADALTELTDKKNSASDENAESGHHQSESHKQQGEDRPPNTCSNQFKPISNEPHQSNLITSLITKIDSLQLKNSAQTKELEVLTSKLGEVSTLLLNKTLENQRSMEVLSRYKLESDRAFYVILISLSLSGLTLCCLTCLCLMRRKELLQIRLKDKDKDKFEVKKSNSIK